MEKVFGIQRQLSLAKQDTQVKSSLGQILFSRNILAAFACCIICANQSNAQVGISNTTITPHSSSVLELRSTTSGFLPPRMTTTERDAISSPATGLLIYNTTTSQLNYYTSSVWLPIVANGQPQLSGTGFVKATGTTISYDNSTYLTTLTGDITSIGSATTIGASKVTNSMLAGSIDLTTKVINTLPVSRGGTGQAANLVQGGIMYGASTTAAGVTAAGSTGQMLRSAGTGAPAWSTATYPATAGTAGSILKSDGTNFISTPLTFNQTTDAVASTVATVAPKMLGYGTTITPSRSGTILIMVSGDMNHPTSAQGGQVQIAYGTGTAPVTGGAPTGTTTGSAVKYINGSGNQGSNIKVPFSVQSIVSGLTVGTAYWVDLQGASTSTTALSVNNVTVSIIEL